MIWDEREREKEFEIFLTDNKFNRKKMFYGLEKKGKLAQRQTGHSGNKRFSNFISPLIFRLTYDFLPFLSPPTPARQSSALFIITKNSKWNFSSKPTLVDVG